MKKMLYLMLTLLLIASCGNNPKKKTAESDLPVVDSVKIIQPKLHPILVEGVLEELKYKDNIVKNLRPGAPLVSIDESFIAIIFIADPAWSNVNSTDSTIRISYYDFPGHTAPVGEYYKGIIENVGGYNVGIFDVGGFGEKYYNIDSIKYVPLENFKHYDFEVGFSNMYYVKNGELVYRNS